MRFRLGIAVCLDGQDLDAGTTISFGVKGAKPGDVILPRSYLDVFFANGARPADVAAPECTAPTLH